MKSGSFIKFENLDTVLYIRKGDKGYEDLKKINKDGGWTQYVNEMLVNKVSVRYDFLTDSFIIVPIERKLKEAFDFYDDYEPEEARVINVKDIEDIFGDIVSSTVSSEVKRGFDLLRNDLFGTIETISTSSEKEVNEKNLETARKNNDSDLFLTNYEKGASVHPDLTRIMGDALKPVEEESEYEEFLFDEFITQEQPVVEPMTKNCYDNIEGIRVRLVLDGVLITEPELRSIVTECQKKDLVVKKIVGKGDALAFSVLNESKEMIPIYLDSEKIMVNKVKFGRLNEALDFAGRSLIKEEKSRFDKIYDKTIKESYNRNNVNIIKGKEQKSSWNVINLGDVNLKTGFNTKIHNLLDQTIKENTLVKNKEGRFYLVKGTLRDRSKKGVKTMIFESGRNNKQNFLGDFEVVGTFENTIKGLGEVMYECKKTSVGLLFFN